VIVKSFANNVFKLFSGLFLAQLINIGFSLLLPRIYDPSDFANFGIFIATALILFEINNFKLDYALMLPNDEEERIGLYKKALYYSTMFSGALLGIYLLYILLPFENHAYYLGWVAVSVFVNGIYQPTITYCNRHQMYRIINFSRILQAIVTGLVSCAPIFLFTPKILLIEGFVMGQLAGLFVMSRLFLSLLEAPSKMNEALLLKFVHFPKFGTWSALLNTLSRNMVFYFLQLFFNPSQVGSYTFTHRLVNAPLGLITNAVGQAYFREASVSRTKEHLQQLTTKIILILSLTTIIPIILVMGWGPAIFATIFGDEWNSAGEIAKILALWYGLSLVVTPLTMLLDVKGYLKWELKYNILFFLIRLLGLILGGILGDFYITLAIFCGIGVVFNIYMLVFIQKIIQKDENIVTA
jgi:O-antigen/teichoic acid export membrane protein